MTREAYYKEYLNKLVLTIRKLNGCPISDYTVWNAYCRNDGEYSSLAGCKVKKIAKGELLSSCNVKEDIILAINYITSVMVNLAYKYNLTFKDGEIL